MEHDPFQFAAAEVAAEQRYQRTVLFSWIAATVTITALVLLIFFRLTKIAGFTPSRVMVGAAAVSPINDSIETEPFQVTKATWKLHLDCRPSRIVPVVIGAHTRLYVECASHPRTLEVINGDTGGQ